MNAKELLKLNVDFTHNVTKMYVDDIANDEMFVRAVEGSNHLAWQLGHLVASEKSLLESIGAETPDLPEGFADAHGKETTESDDPSKFLEKADYLALMETMHGAALAAIDATSEEALDEPAPERLRSFFPTVGSVLLMMGGHEMMHSGQIAAIRRKLGKPIVI